MGLLTDTRNRQKIIDIIARYCNLICFVCYAVGLVWFALLAYEPLNAKTYFSENALLPGLVRAQYNEQRIADRYFDEIKLEAEKHQRSAPWEWIRNEMRKLGLDVFVQNYTFQYPLRIIGDQNVTGRNVYGVLRARKTTGTEAVVMSLPYRPPASTQPKTYGGLALMLSMIQSMRSKTYWSKDIIFLVTEHEHIGMQAWLDAYHHSQVSSFIRGGDLYGRGGSIQAAINLEIEHSSVNELDLKLEGLNGQLPNLDLVNTVVRLCRREGVQPTLHHKNQHWNLETYDGFQRSLETMLAMMWSQASGSPSGNHGLFHRYHIEAVTIFGKGGRHSRHGFFTMGRVIEGVYRSLSNLMERFHQSFFFYLLPSTERYVSIGLYMPPFGLLVVGCLIKAVALWVSYVSPQTPTAENDKSAGEAELVSFTTGLASVLPVTTVSVAFGLAAYFGTDFFVGLSVPFHMQSGDGLLYGGLALFVSAAFYPRLLTRSDRNKTMGPDWILLKSVSLIVEGLVLFSTALMNISLATLLAAVMVPVTVSVTPTHSRVLRILKAIPMILVSPFSLIFAYSTVQVLMTDQFTTVQELLTKTLDNTQHALLLGALQGQMLGNWTFGLMTLVVFSNWLMFWGLLWTGHPSLGKV